MPVPSVTVYLDTAIAIELAMPAFHSSVSDANDLIYCCNLLLANIIPVLENPLIMQLVLNDLHWFNLGSALQQVENSRLLLSDRHGTTGARLIAVSVPEAGDILKARPCSSLGIRFGNSFLRTHEADALRPKGSTVACQYACIGSTEIDILVDPE